MNRLHISVLVVFFFVALVWVGQQIIIVSPTIAEQEEDLLIPDYVATNLQTTLYNKQGLVNSFLSAKKMEHFSELDFTSFDTPIYTLHTATENQPWQLTAKEATLYGNQRLEFEREVVLSSIDEQGYLRQINTNFLQVDIDLQTIATDQSITIFGKNFQVQGIGMDGNLDLKKINLHNHVRTTYRYEKS